MTVQYNFPNRTQSIVFVGLGGSLEAQIQRVKFIIFYQLLVLGLRNAMYEQLFLWSFFFYFTYGDANPLKSVLSY